MSIYVQRDIIEIKWSVIHFKLSTWVIASRIREENFLIKSNTQSDALYTNQKYKSFDIAAADITIIFRKILIAFN